MACQEQARFSVSQKAFFEPIQVAVLHTWCSIPHIPVPSSLAAWSISLLPQKSTDTVLLTERYHWGIRFSGGLTYGRWHLDFWLHLWYKWLSVHHWKIWRWAISHSSFVSSFSWSLVILYSIFPWPVLMLPGLFPLSVTGRWFSSLMQMVFCLCQSHISWYYVSDRQYISDILF